MYEADSYQQAGNAERRDRDRRQLGAQSTASRRQRVVVGVVVAIAAAAGLYFLMSPGPGSISEVRPFDHAAPANSNLTLEWTGRECEFVDADRTEVAETADEVRITLSVAVPTGCTRPVMDRTHQLDLEEPLGDRAVRDVGCTYPAYLDDERC